MKNSATASAANDQDVSIVDPVQTRIDLIRRKLEDCDPDCRQPDLFHLCSWIKTLDIPDDQALDIITEFRIRARTRKKDTSPGDIKSVFRRAKPRRLDGWARKFFGGFSDQEEALIFEQRTENVITDSDDESLPVHEKVAQKYRALGTLEIVKNVLHIWEATLRRENKAQEHGYVRAKGIQPLGGAVYMPGFVVPGIVDPEHGPRDDLLLIPLRNPRFFHWVLEEQSGSIPRIYPVRVPDHRPTMPYAYQAISPDGKLKRLPSKDDRYVAHFTHGVIDPETILDQSTVIVPEGYGQSCTVAELTGCRTIMAMGIWALPYIAYLFATGDLEAECVLFVPDVGEGAEKKAREAIAVLQEASNGQVKAGYILPRKPDGETPKNYGIDDMALEDREAARGLLEEAIEQLKAGQLNNTPATGFLLGPNGKTLPQNQAAQVLAERLPMIGYDPIRRGWRQYVGNCWQEVPDAEIFRAVNTQVAAGVPSGYGIQFLRGCMAFLELELCQRFGESPKHLIPFRNGVLNLEAQEFLEHSPSHGFTWILKHDYDPSATCEPFLIWLREVLQDEGDAPSDVAEKVEILRAFIRAVLTGRADLQRFLALIGPPGTGKGTILRVLEELVGTENTHVTDFRTLEKSRFETAKLYGKRLLVITDAEEFSEELSTFKAITGYDSLRYEEKNKQVGTSFKFQGLAALAGNAEPRSKDLSGALHRRQLTLYLRNVTPPDRRRNLEAEFRPLLPGIVNWALSMRDGEMIRLLVDTNRSSKSARAAAIESLRNVNPIARWADENLVYTPDEIETPIGVPAGKTAADESRSSYAQKLWMRD